MSSAATLLVLQLSVALCPGAIVEGFATKFSVIALTVTVACAVAVPPLLVAVMTYVVVCFGVITTEPDAAKAEASSGRGAGAIVNVVAFVLDHVRVASCPRTTVAGLTDTVTVGGLELPPDEPPVVGGVVVEAPPPEHPVREISRRKTQ